MQQSERLGYVVFAHGSPVESANEAVRITAAGLRASSGEIPVESAFLDGGQPDLGGAVARLADSGVGRVVVIPYFLTLGLHMKRDLPLLLNAIREQHPGLEIEVTAPLDGHPALQQILLDRAKEGVDAWLQRQ